MLFVAEGFRVLVHCPLVEPLLKGGMDKASRALTRVMIQKSRAGERDGNNRVLFIYLFIY